MDSFIWPDIFDTGVKAFFTRKSVGADLDKICKILSLGREAFFLPVQKHTDTIVLLNQDRKPVIADAVVTRQTGVLIGVQVADCIPALLQDRKRHVVGVVHAGWRGTSMQIVKKTILFMAEKFGSDPRDISMAFGPSIRGACYPVNIDVKDAVMTATGSGDYVTKRGDEWCLDLASANVVQAVSAGIPKGNIWISPECTYCNPDDFHSFRYHKNFAGRQAGFIGIF